MKHFIGFLLVMSISIGPALAQRGGGEQRGGGNRASGAGHVPTHGPPHPYNQWVGHDSGRDDPRYHLDRYQPS